MRGRGERVVWEREEEGERKRRESSEGEGKRRESIEVDLAKRR